MKKNYNTPEVSVYAIEALDVLTLSGFDANDEDNVVIEY